MKTFQHRRHTKRNPTESHINQFGLELARRVGAKLAPFDYAATSDLPRAIETAVSMGFAVRETHELLATWPPDVAAEAYWDAGFAAWHQAAQKKGAAWKYMQSLRELHFELLAKIPEGGRLLVVSHGGVVEASAVGCWEDPVVAGWGEALSYCEGFELQIENGKVVAGKPLRDVM